MKRTWVKTEDEINRLRKSSRYLADIVEILQQAVMPGVTTGELGKKAEELIRKAGGEPIFKGYGKAWGAPPFPAAVCLSVDHEVVHGIPSSQVVLQSGQLLKIDIGMRFAGMVSDMARTIPVGEISLPAKNLLDTTRVALEAGVKSLRPGTTMEEYARAVERVVESNGYSCVRDLVGHGVGQELHEDPQIPNYTHSRLPAFQFEEGMTVALEPMVNMGGYQVELSDDGWTFVTVDRKLSAHFEDTVLITSSGAEVLTRPSSFL